MRGYVLRALLRKEALRLMSQRGTLGMALLMIVAAVLLSTLGTGALASLGGGGDVSLCVVDYWRVDEWLRHLERNRPADPSRRVELRSLANQQGYIRYPTGAAGIQLRPRDPAPEVKVWVWHPGESSSAAAWCEDWFWTESRRFFVQKARAELPGSEQARFDREVAVLLEQGGPTSLRRESHERFREQLGRALVKAGVPDARATSLVPTLELERSALRSMRKMGPREAAAMALSLLALLFVGVFLLPQVSCEEREHGTLLAVALSPASAREILAARMLFYFGAASALSLTVGGISVPFALLNLYTWLAVGVIALGSVGVGMTIAAIARTQREASTGAMLYLFATGLLLIAGKGGPLEPVTLFMLERHGPEMLLAAFSGRQQGVDWLVLGWTAAIASIWTLIASVAFRRSGWR